MKTFDLHFNLLRGILDQIKPGWIGNKIPPSGFNNRAALELQIKFSHL
jgi:hypothetical protein